MIWAFKQFLSATNILWLGAFLCSLYIINAWQLGFFAGAILLILIWAGLILSSPKILFWQTPKSPIPFLVGGLWLLTFISTLHSEIFYISFLAFCFFSALPLTFFIFAYAQPRESFTPIFKALGVIYTVLAIWALIQFFFLAPYFEGRAHHPLANPNSLGAFFSLGFFGAFGWFYSLIQNSRHTLYIYLSGGLALLLFAGLVATGSRGALLSLLPALIIFLFVFRELTLKNWKIIGILLTGCALIFLASSYGPIERDTMVGRIAYTATQQLYDVSSNRFALWQASWDIIKAHGMFGTGIGTYFLYFPEFRLEDDKWGAYYAHNDPLQFWTELGILGPILFYMLALSIISRTFKAINKTNNNVLKLQVIAPFCALCAFGLHAHVTFNFYNLSLLFIGGFALAYWLRTTHEALHTTPKTIEATPNTNLYRHLILIPLFITAGIFSTYLVSEYHTNKARNHLISSNLESFADHIILANKFSLQGNYRPYILAVNVPLTLLENSEQIKGPDHQKQILNQAKKYLDHVHSINPRSASSYYYMGKIVEIAPPEFNQDNDIGPAEQLYKKALQLDPLHIGSRLALSQIYTNQGHNDLAIKILEQGVHYKYATPTAMDLYNRLLEIYQQQEEETENHNKQVAIIQKMRSFQIRLLNDKKQKEKPLYKHLFAH